MYLKWILLKNNYLLEVKEQYEDYPYPERDPEAEKYRLLSTQMDDLEKLNHYGFAGSQTFQQAQLLVAGCGTGDAVIFLAEQLRETKSTVTALDMSAASLAVAKQRAKIRGLENIIWIQSGSSLFHVGRSNPLCSLCPLWFIDL